MSLMDPKRCSEDFKWARAHANKPRETSFSFLLEIAERIKRKQTQSTKTIGHCEYLCPPNSWFLVSSIIWSADWISTCLCSWLTRKKRTFPQDWRLKTETPQLQATVHPGGWRICVLPVYLCTTVTVGLACLLLVDPLSPAVPVSVDRCR